MCGMIGFDEKKFFGQSAISRFALWRSKYLTDTAGTYFVEFVLKLRIQRILTRLCETNSLGVMQQRVLKILNPLSLSCL